MRGASEGFTRHKKCRYDVGFFRLDFFETKIVGPTSDVFGSKVGFVAARLRRGLFTRQFEIFESESILFLDNLILLKLLLF